MGCGSVRVNIITSLTNTLESLESEISSIKSEKKSICDELDKYSYQETMVGKDILDLKLSFTSSIDSFSSVLEGFHSISTLQDSINNDKLEKSSQIISTYSALLNRFQQIIDIKQEHNSILSELNKTKKQVLDIEAEKLNLEKCFSANHEFLNNSEAFDHECRALIMQKEELEDELSGRSSPIMLLRTSKSRLQEVIRNLTEEEAAKELEKLVQRNENVEKMITFYREGNDIGNALGSHARTEKVTKEYNAMIKAKKVKIEERNEELREVSREIEKIQQSILGKMNYDQRMEMLNEIIQKCRASINKGSKIQFKKLLRKKTLLETVEKTVQKARKVE